MKTLHFLVAFVLLASASPLAFASDPGPLQDFCVGINNTGNGVFVNGKFCKDPGLVIANDFFFQGLNIPRPTNNQVGSTVTLINVEQFLGLNTLGVAIARIDYAPNGGENPPHMHPRASEILLVMQGTLFVGFVTSNPNNTLFSKVLNQGDLFVFPQGMIHFQVNLGRTNAVAFASFGSQNPGLITVANAVFGSNPRINPFILARAFQLNPNVVKNLQAKFWNNN
ncbi:hypothetical protein Pint_20282 [Pistacia integerrima]|uniref:Uncharacterized protein n=1 Tax=Pistacia integerrima TaxID=434235 RepID=A0ACC0XF87_9ROSI|nr:hypothetical protein Pint_20282 [Pistacia integerrima]